VDAADRTSGEAAPAAERPSGRVRAEGSESRPFSGEVHPARKPRGFSRLSVRIMALSIFPVATIFGGLLYVGAYERSLVESELKSLGTQARLFATAIAEAAVPAVAGEENPIDRQTATQVMRQLSTNTVARARLFEQDGRLVADTQSPVREEDLPSESTGDWITNQIIALYEWFFNLLTRDRETIPIYREKRDQTAADFQEVRTALAGETRSFIRRGDHGDFVLFYAAPVQRYKKVHAALLLSSSSADIARSVRQVRLDILRIVAVVTVFTVLLAFYLARSIARPINRLAASADSMRRSRSRSASLPDFTYREDEIGDLSAALNDLTNELWRRLDAIESFAADVAHELKNPLASIKSAIETVGRLRDPEKQARLLDMIREDVDRLSRLINDISRASRLDTELSRIVPVPVDIARILGTLADIHSASQDSSRPRVRLVLPDKDRLIARGVEDRLVQVFQNILANAASFSPPGGVIGVTGSVEGGSIRITVEDEGPGIPAGKEKAIFNRFYSERPVGEKFGTHSGLGLSISQQIIDAIGGTIHAENVHSLDGRVRGARFVVRLPRAT
jgi:two-component system sensor histidine kinase ChvG